MRADDTSCPGIRERHRNQILGHQDISFTAYDEESEEEGEGSKARWEDVALKLWLKVLILHL